MDMIRLEHPEYMYFFLVIPFLAGIYLLARFARRRALKSFGRQDIVTQLMPWASSSRPLIRFILVLLAITMIIMAAINPQIGSKLQEATHEGIDIIVAIDVSTSMLAEDIRPNRIERAKLAVSRLIDRLEGDRIGIVVFAGNAITQVPLTSDHQAASMMLRTISTNSVNEQGTAIGAAIERAVAAFSEEDLSNKVLIIISDGENHQDDPVAAASEAGRKGLTIHTIGIGTPEGAPIPVYSNKQLTGFMRDNQGNTIVSRFDEQTLRQIALSANGTFQEGRGADMGLSQILTEIKSLDKQAYESMVFADYESRFHYFTAIALILLLLELLIYERKNKWLRKIKLF